MPIYEFGCECGATTLERFSMDIVPRSLLCGRCGNECSRIFSAPQVRMNSLYSDENKRGLAEMDAKAPKEEMIYNKRFDRRAQSL